MTECADRVPVHIYPALGSLPRRHSLQGEKRLRDEPKECLRGRLALGSFAQY